jgi:hypothetical protein
MKLDKSDKIVIYGAVGTALGFAVSKIMNTDKSVSMIAGSSIGSIVGNHDQKGRRITRRSSGKRKVCRSRRRR